jgi:Domain of unknown function (DUF3291)
MSESLHIAQLNIARAVAPLDSPVMAGFVERLAEINALADSSPGFVWRLQTPAGDATSLRVFDDPLIIVNMSVWQNIESLHAYVYRSAHAGVMAARKRWFAKYPGPYYVLWWVERGHTPTVEEGKARLAQLAATGPSAEVFWFGAPSTRPPVQSSARR